MLIALLALLTVQDPQWAMQAREAGRASGIEFANDLTGAQREACFEVLERAGATVGTGERLEQRIANLDSAIASEADIDRGAEAEAMRQQALVIARRYRDDLHMLALENRRNAHALGSIVVTVCRPAQRVP